jgi:hypothetical protein
MISSKKEVSIWDSKGNIYMLLNNHFPGSNVVQITFLGPFSICPGINASSIPTYLDDLPLSPLSSISRFFISFAPDS